MSFESKRDILGAYRGDFIINGQTHYSSSAAMAYYVLESGSRISSIKNQDGVEVSHLLIFNTGSTLSAGTLIVPKGDPSEDYFISIAVTGSVTVLFK